MTTNQQIREQIWPLMPVERCYGEPDIWCDNCKEALSQIMSLIDTAVREARHSQAEITYKKWCSLEDDDDFTDFLRAELTSQSKEKTE